LKFYFLLRSRAADDRREDRYQLKFKPQLSLIRFLERSTEFRDELGFGTNPRSFPSVSRDRCAGTEHLPCTNLDFIAFFGQLHIKSHDKGRKLLCSRPEFIGQPSLSHFNFASSLSAFHFPLSTFRFPLSTFHFCHLNRIHEGTLDVIEKHDAEE
jgi:hypothetical protein